VPGAFAGPSAPVPVPSELAGLGRALGPRMAGRAREGPVGQPRVTLLRRSTPRVPVQGRGAGPKAPAPLRGRRLSTRGGLRARPLPPEWPSCSRETEAPRVPPRRHRGRRVRPGCAGESVRSPHGTSPGVFGDEADLVSHVPPPARGGDGAETKTKGALRVGQAPNRHGSFPTRRRRSTEGSQAASVSLLPLTRSRTMKMT
jgi:hypothetical protein